MFVISALTVLSNASCFSMFLWNEVTMLYVDGRVVCAAGGAASVKKEVPSAATSLEPSQGQLTHMRHADAADECRAVSDS